MPLPGMAGTDSFFGSSTNMASVVVRMIVTEAASCSAMQTTFAGPMVLAWTRSPYSSTCASHLKVGNPLH